MSTTPGPQDSAGSRQQQRSNSQTRRPHTPTSRPTTPLRPSSRSSFRESARRAAEGGAGGDHYGGGGGGGGGGGDPYGYGDVADFPLNAFEPAFAELSDAVADLEANMMHFQLMHESLSRFSESFASFLYGLNMNAFCVDFPEGPIAESFRRAKQNESQQAAETAAPPSRARSADRGDLDGETTFMTTDTSFIDNPPASRATPKKTTTTATRQSRMPGPSSRGTTSSRGRAGTARGRTSGLVRPRARGLR